MKTLKEERPPPKCLASFWVFSPFGMAKKKKGSLPGQKLWCPAKGREEEM